MPRATPEYNHDMAQRKKVIWRLRKMHHAASHTANHLYGCSYR
jgi:hypothetical protein